MQPRAIRTLLLPSRERHYSVTRCSPLSLDPALVRLVHAACRTSALNQNHVALAYPSAILPAHDCGIARTIRGCAATIQVSNSSSSGDGMRVDGSLSVYLCLLHAKHSPILREWCQNPPTRRHLTGQAPEFLFGALAKGSCRDGGSSCNQLLTTSLIY